MESKETEMRVEQGAPLEHANIISPVIGLRMRDLAMSGVEVLRKAVRQPIVGAEHSARLLAEVARIAVGASDIAPDPRDRRFADDAFADNGLFRRLVQSWCAVEHATDDWLQDIGFEDDDLRRARFVAHLVTDALAPTNFLLGNPSALRRARETKGISLLRGLANLLRDLKNNGGMPSQVDTEPFRVGVNLGTSPGSVVLEHPVAELIQYSPMTSRVRARPVLIAPPQINKFFVYDLTPEKSVVRYLLEQGFQVFILSWKNPSVEERDWGLAEYIDGVGEALTAVRAVTRQNEVDVVGACAGGITATAALAYFEGLGLHGGIGSLTLMVSVLEPRKEDTDAGLFLSDDAIEAARKRSSRAGVLDGRDTARVFSWMRPNDLIWNYVANNYLHGNRPPAFDLLYWNADTTRLPARLHSDFLNVFKDNPFRNPGAMSIRDVPLDIRKVRCPVFVTGGTTDHITPWQACYRSTQLFPGDVTFVLSTAGHIQSIINPPGSSKRRFMTNPNTPKDAGKWLRDAEEHVGSWWPCWTDWLRKLSADERPAPRVEGSSAYPPLRPAPGKYVHEK